MHERFRFTPAEIDRLVGISPTVQRDRRRRGSEYFGQQLPKGKEYARWHFSSLDVLGLAVADIMLTVVGDLFEAERIGYWVAPAIAWRLGLTDAEFLSHPGAEFRGKRFAAFGRGASPAFHDDDAAAKWLVDDVPAVALVDLAAMAADVKARLGDEGLRELKG